MIIRMTVGDNDFTDIIESFASYMFFQDTCFPSDENIRKLYNDDKVFRNLWSEVTNGTGKLSNEDKEIFIDIIKQKYTCYIQRRLDDSDVEYQNYLLDNFKVSLQESITPHWENGEVVYMFINAGGKHITL